MDYIRQIYNNYRLTDNQIILDLIINLYLFNCNYRNICQIKIKSKICMDNIINIIKLSLYDYEIIDTDESQAFQERHSRLIIYNKNTFDINILDRTFGQKYATQLGKFYIFASDNFELYDYQIGIQVKNINVEILLYSQMCDKIMLKENIDFFIIIMNEVKKLLYDLDNNLIIDLIINNN